MRGYPIGDVSRTLGLTPGALHFYEREGIIQPPKEKESGRRFYTQADLIRLLSCRKYRAMDVSLKTIAQQFSQTGDSLNVISERLRDQYEKTLEKAAYYQLLAEEIADFTGQIERLPEESGHFSVRSSPDVYLLKAKDGLISRDKKEQELVRRWLEAMPATRISIVWDEKAQRAEYCYIIEKKRAALLGAAPEEETPEANSRVQFLRDAMCVTTVICDERMHEEPEVAFEPVFSYMKEHGLRRSGQAWATLLVVDCSQGTRNTYARVWVPFQ